MPIVSFRGCSDDLFEIEGGVEDEIGCYKEAVLRVAAPGDAPLNVVGEYSRHGTGAWMVGLQIVDDGMWPDWATESAISYKLDKTGCSPILTLDVPPGTIIIQLWPAQTECSECGSKREPLKWYVK